MVAVLGAVALTVGADDSQTGLTTTVFKVDGMTCGGCEVGVKVAVKKLDGVEKVTASYKDARAAVTYDRSKVTVEEIEAAIEKIGYSAEVAEGEDGESVEKSAEGGLLSCVLCS
jgi:copper chaperone CopZ